MDAINIRTHVRNDVRKIMIVQTFWNILFKMISSPFWKLFKRRDTCQSILSPPLQDEASPSSSSQCTSISLDEISPMVVFDEACEDLFKQYPKKERKLYDGSMKFQDVYTTSLPWVESIINEKGAMHQVRCKIWTFVWKKKNFWFQSLTIWWTMSGIKNARCLGQFLTIFCVLDNLNKLHEVYIYFCIYKSFKN
jgi:hypothetical protein